mgnify:CR=1 FL=1
MRILRFLWDVIDIAANGPKDQRSMRLCIFGLGVGEVLAIASAAKSLFGGAGGDENGDLQTEIGKALLQQFKDTQKIRGPFERDMAGAIKSRRTQTLPLDRIKIGARPNPIAPGKTVTSIPRTLAAAAPTASGEPGMNVGSFLGNKAALPTAP